MNGVPKAITLFILLAVALLRIPAGAAIKIGTCSLGTFIYGGQSCQRTMMKNLKNNPQLSCSAEYDKLKDCVTNHVTTCVKGDILLKDMAGQITKLLLMQAYHCGNQRVDVSDISLLLWRVTKCKPERLNQTFDCWNEFHSNFTEFVQSSSAPTTLCGPYAKAKRDCAEVAMAACEGLCEYLVKDKYNTFCPATPPHDPEKYDIKADCSSLHQLNCNDSVLYEKAMECEDQGADSFANDNNHDCSEEKTRNRKCLEESLTSNALCTSNVQLLDQTEKALHGTLSNERLFCNEVNLNTASLDDDIQSLVDCQPEFFDEAENCARPFRDNFKTTAAAERISDQTCSDYKTARECINNARKDYCNFKTGVLAITANINNPFCPPSDATTTSVSLMLQLVACIIQLLLFS